MKFDLFDEELQAAIVQVAAEKNMSPQEYLNSLTSPSVSTMSLREFIDSIDLETLGSFSQEVLNEVLAEIRPAE